MITRRPGGAFTTIRILSPGRRDGWTGTPWPDLAVAVVAAKLFLSSAWSIIRNARSELYAAGAASP